jgi:undecaprenyl-diphosphatase
MTDAMQILRQMRWISQRLWQGWHRLPTFGGHKPLFLLIALLLAAAVWTFVAIANEVMEGDTQAFDQVMLLVMRTPGNPTKPWGPRWLEGFGRNVTALGSAEVLTLVTLAVLGVLLLQGKIGVMVMVVTAVGGGMLLSIALKEHFDRPRPALVLPGVLSEDASFPSGHAMHAAVGYLTLGIVLAGMQPQRRLKVYVLVLAIGLILLIGLSRVYLGAHWPTDVLAGWAAGTAWGLIVWGVTLWLQQRGRVEQAN